MNTNETPEEVLKRVAKLLAMTESSNPNEAAIASQKAVELMARYSISEADVESFSVGAQAPKVTETRTSGAQGNHLQDFEVRLAAGVAAALQCEVLVYSGYGSGVKFIGFKTDVQFAVELFGMARDWILSNSITAREQYIKRTIDNYGVHPKVWTGTSRHPRAWQRNWSIGAADAIGSRCKDTYRKVAEEMDRYDIVLVKEGLIKAHMQENYPRLGRHHTDSAGRGYAEGYEAGKHAPLPGGKELPN